MKTPARIRRATSWALARKGPIAVAIVSFSYLVWDILQPVPAYMKTSPHPLGTLGANPWIKALVILCIFMGPVLIASAETRRRHAARSAPNVTTAGTLTGDNQQ